MKVFPCWLQVIGASLGLICGLAQAEDSTPELLDKAPARPAAQPSRPSPSSSRPAPQTPRPASPPSRPSNGGGRTAPSAPRPTVIGFTPNRPSNGGGRTTQASPPTTRPAATPSRPNNGGDRPAQQPSRPNAGVNPTLTRPTRPTVAANHPGQKPPQPASVGNRPLPSPTRPNPVANHPGQQRPTPAVVQAPRPASPGLRPTGVGTQRPGGTIPLVIPRNPAPRPTVAGIHLNPTGPQQPGQVHPGTAARPLTTTAVRPTRDFLAENTTRGMLGTGTHIRVEDLPRTPVPNQVPSTTGVPVAGVQNQVITLPTQQELDASVQNAQNYLDQMAANQPKPFQVPPSALQDPATGFQLLGTMGLGAAAMGGMTALAVSNPEILAALATGASDATAAVPELLETPLGQVASSYALSQLGDTGMPPTSIWDFIGSNLDDLGDYLFGETDAY